MNNENRHDLTMNLRATVTAAVRVSTVRGTSGAGGNFPVNWMPGRPCPRNAVFASEAPRTANPPLRAQNQNPNFPFIGQGQGTTISDSDDQLTTTVIYVHPGQDLVEIVKLCCENGRKGVVILGATGTISRVTICPPTISRQILFEGQFQLVSLTASPFMDVARGSIALTVSIAQTDGVVIGGRVTGPMIAGSPMQIVIGTFVPYSMMMSSRD